MWVARPRPTRRAARRRSSRALSGSARRRSILRSASCASQRDLAGGERVFREGARSDPAEVSAFIKVQQALGFAAELVSRALEVSRSAHYRPRSGHRSARAFGDEQLVTTIRRLHEANFEAYGYAKYTSRFGAPGSRTSDGRRPQPPRARLAAGPHTRASLVCDALRMAVCTRTRPSLAHPLPA